VTRNYQNLELALSQEVCENLEELDQMNWSGNVLNQYLSNTSIGTTVSRISGLDKIKLGPEM
jgi:hypothetical protein